MTKTAKAKSKSLKTEIRWDNGNTSFVGMLDYEAFTLLKSIIIEVSRGNALELRLNGELSLSIPEKHSGDLKHVVDIMKELARG